MPLGSPPAAARDGAGPSWLFPRGVYYAATAGLVVLLLSTLPHRVAHFDDAWGAELAYWLAKDGYAHTELFRGIGDGSDQHAYVFHKAFIYLEAGLFQALGPSLYVAKAAGLLFAAAGLGLLLRACRGGAEARWLAAVLYLGCGALVLAAFIGRPETLTMSAGLASFLCLRGARGRAGRLALAGALAGLAGLAHLHGLAYLVAGGLWLLWQRPPLRGVLAFGAGGTLTVLLYPLDALVNHQLPVLLHQFGHAPVTQASQHVGAKLAVMAQYPAVFFHSESEAVLTGLLLVLGALAWRRGPQRWFLTAAQRYVLLLLLSFWVLCARADAYYFVLFLPFFVLVAVELALSAPLQTGWRRTAVRALLVLYPLGAGVRAYHLGQARQAQPWPATENARLARYMPRRGSVAVVPLDFFFNEMGHYRLRGLTAYAMRNHTQYQDTLSLNGFFALAAQDSARYVVSDHRSDNGAFPIPACAPARIGRYTRVFQDRWHSVYRRND